MISTCLSYIVRFLCDLTLFVRDDYVYHQWTCIACIFDADNARWQQSTGIWDDFNPCYVATMYIYIYIYIMIPLASDAPYSRKIHDWIVLHGLVLGPGRLGECTKVCLLLCCDTEGTPGCVRSCLSSFLRGDQAGFKSHNRVYCPFLCCDIEGILGCI